MIDNYITKEEKSQTTNLPPSHLKELEEEEQSKPKVNRLEEIINIGAEIENRKARGKKLKLRVVFIKKKKGSAKLTNA